MTAINIERTRKKRNPFKIFFLIFILSIIVGGIFTIKIYNTIFKSNVYLENKNYIIIQIHSGFDYDDVLNILEEKSILINKSSFEWVSKRKNYVDNVKAGQYKITNGMNNNSLVNMFRSGRQLAVQFTFNNIRLLNKLSSIAGDKLELDSASLMNLLTDKEYMSKYNLKLEEVPCIFIPNTYEIYWNNSAEEFIERMYEEYNKFWNADRQALAKKINLTPHEITALASIVQEETNIIDEMATISGVYINRLRKNMPLQADPTVRFAIGDFTIIRILNEHLEFESDYNTYLHTGIPPGPICLVNQQTIDELLNYEKHNYLFFCAKEDFSGYHVFAETNAQHERNAVKYRIAIAKLEKEKRKKETNRSLLN